MDEPDAFDQWPDYLPGPRNDLLALGVIALNYGRLENIFRIIFAMVSGMSEAQVTAIFARINNRLREDIFEQLLATQTFPEGLIDLIRHWLAGYMICAENRNAVMHSHHGGIHSGARGTEGIVLSKFSRAGSRFSYFAHAKALRAIADAIDHQGNFGEQVMLEIAGFQLCERQKRPRDFGQFPLPEKPRLPEALNWLPHSDLRVDPRPPESSPG